MKTKHELIEDLNTLKAQNRQLKQLIADLCDATFTSAESIHRATGRRMQRCLSMAVEINDILNELYPVNY